MKQLAIVFAAALAACQQAAPDTAAHQEQPPQVIQQQQGSQAALGCPSRIGDRLHYRDGRITTMTGELVKPQTNPTKRSRA